MHDSRLIANKFIERSRNAGTTLTPMQLLKLVYIAHGWMLGLYGVPLTRHRIEAWKFGPVIPTLYHAVKQFGDGPVYGNLPHDAGDQLVPVEDDLVRQVFEIYGGHSGIALSNITHQPGTPWARSYVPGISNIPIPDDIIREHYQQLIASRQTQQ